MFWLAAVRDAFSNRIVGWKTSDRGSTYTSIRFAQHLADNGILPSMGSVGDSYDTQSSIEVEERRLGA